MTQATWRGDELTCLDVSNIFPLTSPPSSLMPSSVDPEHATTPSHISATRGLGLTSLPFELRQMILRHHLEAILVCDGRASINRDFVRLTSVSKAFSKLILPVFKWACARVLSIFEELEIRRQDIAKEAEALKRYKNQRLSVMILPRVERLIVALSKDVTRQMRELDAGWRSLRTERDELTEMDGTLKHLIAVLEDPYVIKLTAKPLARWLQNRRSRIFGKSVLEQRAPPNLEAAFDMLIRG